MNTSYGTITSQQYKPIVIIHNIYNDTMVKIQECIQVQFLELLSAAPPSALFSNSINFDSII